MIDRVNRECRTAEIGCIDCKTLVADAMVEKLRPIWDARAKLVEKPDQLEQIVEDGTKKAKAASAETLAEVREAIKI